MNRCELPQPSPNYDPSIYSDEQLCAEVAAIIFNERRGTAGGSYITPIGLAMLPHEQSQTSETLRHLVQRPDLDPDSMQDVRSGEVAAARTDTIEEFVGRLAAAYGYSRFTEQGQQNSIGEVARTLSVRPNPAIIPAPKGRLRK